MVKKHEGNKYGRDYYEVCKKSSSYRRNVWGKLDQVGLLNETGYLTLPSQFSREMVYGIHEDKRENLRTVTVYLFRSDQTIYVS